MANCPTFWRNRTIKINLMNLKDENLQTSAFIAIGLDLFVGIGFVLICCCTLINMEESFKIILTRVIFVIAIPLIDTCTGKGK